ncbi:hypothetical protein ACFST9_00230 [Hymenobacter monticola]|uniref:Uncharacterized protein n=1 Tax=Hymenobacter monticola TaxID=1705399 RepID=A0ABY4BGE3_9BACT|nr:hypothetical protein [Hymenobacter monticola]UOE36811.1 hypothetical protein MTP16_25375 [Hymenobacter monticola]
MAALASRIPGRFGVLLLLSLGALLGSCWSERLAFAFQPTLAAQATSPDVIQPPARVLPAATPRDSTALLTPTVLSRHPRRAGLFATGHDRQQSLPAIAQRVGRIHTRPRVHRTPAGSIRRPSLAHGADKYERYLYTGLVSVGVGLLCLIAALVLLSGLLALAGLGAILPGFFLMATGWNGDGHWSYG